MRLPDGGREFLSRPPYFPVRSLFPDDFLVAPAEMARVVYYENMVHGQNNKIVQASSTRYPL